LARKRSGLVVPTIATWTPGWKTVKRSAVAKPQAVAPSPERRAELLLAVD